MHVINGILCNLDSLANVVNTILVHKQDKKYIIAIQVTICMFKVYSNSRNVKKCNVSVLY